MRLAQHRHQIGKAFGNILTRARVKPRHTPPVFICASHSLHANAIPFPFGTKIGRIELVEIRFIPGMREHRCAERRGIIGFGPLLAPFNPSEEIQIGRHQTMPDFFNLVGRKITKGSHRSLGKPRRDTDAQTACDQFQQSPAACLVEIIQPVCQELRQLRFARLVQRVHNIGERRWRHIAPLGLRCGPQQRHRLRQIADIIIRHGKQHRIGALGNQRTNECGLGMFERQGTRHSGQSKAALGIGRGAEIIGQQTQFVVA